MTLAAQLSYNYINNGGGSFSVIVTINIIDLDTGLPANGNNITVNYTQAIGALIQELSTQIPGQSLIIYNGSYDPTSYWALTNVLPAPPFPPVGSCDLAINNIIVNQDESSPGANDASITVNAFSSYGPISYSLDDITFQSSPTFEGIAGGLVSIYVQDTNPAGCNVAQNVTIPILANLLISDPSVSIGTNVSRWNAVFNPINFNYQRKDFEISAASLYNQNGITGTMLTVNGDMSIIVALVAANVIAGVNFTPIYVYVNTPAYTGIYQVIDATVSTVSINATFTATSVGYLNSDNIKPYYKIITQIQYVDPNTGQTFSVQSLNRSNPAGQVIANISKFLQSLLKAVSASDYTQINYRDTNLSASYRISYAQSCDDGTDIGYTSPFIQLQNTYYATYTARQLGQKYGGNMAEFVPFRNLAAKWLTDFKSPAYSLTFPFDLSFIYGEDLAGFQLYYVITQLDINKNPLPSQILTAYLLNEDGSYLLNTDGSKLIIATTTLGNTPIVEHVGLNRLLIDFDFDSIVYYFKIGIFYNGSTPAGFLYSITNNPFIPGILTPNSSTIEAGAPYTINAYGNSPATGSKFDWQLNEGTTPFVDGNLQIKVNGVFPPAEVDAFTTSNGEFPANYGDSIQINAYGTSSTTATDPKQNLIIIKDGVTIFSKTVPYVPGPTSGIIKTLTCGIDRVYSIHAYATDGTDDLPNIDSDVPDRADIQLTVTRDSDIIFQNKIPYVTGILNGLTKAGTAKSGSTYEVAMITGINLDDVTPIDITDENPVDVSTKQVLSDQLVRIDKDCDDNSVYLRWIGLTGSWNYYRFIFNQEHTLDVQDATIISNYVKDWENQESIEEVIKKSAGEKIQVHATDMSVDDIKGCQSLKISPKVQMLVSKSPIKWQTIVVNTATFAEYETNMGTYEFAVTFNLPSINIQTQ